MPVHRQQRISKETIIADLHEWVRLYGEVPQVREWELEPDFPHPATVRYHFGSWRRAIEAAGYEPRSRGKAGHRETRWNVNV